MTKKCLNCLEEKPTFDFYKSYDRWTDKTYLSSRCKPCHLLYKKNSPTTKRNRKAEKLKLRYGLTYAEWEQMREAEDHKCMSCGITEEELGRVLDVDHCHTNGKARGVLCNKCNTALGHAQDNPDILRALAACIETNVGGYK